MKIVVGLGNPGKEYENTRHNVGFAVIEKLSERFSCKLRRGLWFKARTGAADVSGEKVLLVEPLTYMNNSGTAVASIMRYRHAEPRDIIVVVDDADLETGRLRIKSKGGSGGHKGLDSIIQNVQSAEFARVRIGIGSGGSGEKNLVDHVLRPFTGDEKRLIGAAVDAAVEAVICVLESGVDEAMNRFNAFCPESGESVKEKV